MLKRLVLTATLTLCSVSCALSHSYVIPFGNQLQMLEDVNMVKADNYDIGGNGELLPYLPKLLDIAKEIGYKVTVADHVTFTNTSNGQVDELWGYTDRKLKIIYLSLDQTGNNFVHTFIHELSHAMQPMPLSDAGQVFAESVACIVTMQLGVDSHRESFAYIAQLPDHMDALERYSADIDKLVTFFLTHLKG